jgi:hypothetical protein
MKLRLFSSIAILALVMLMAPPTGRAEDKNKEWQKKQQELQYKQWQLQQQQQPQSSAAAAAAAVAKKRKRVGSGQSWNAGRNGRGTLTFTRQAPDRLNFAQVTLNNFSDAAGNVNNNGAATVTLNGSYQYPMQGTWTMLGGFTVGLNLTPAAGAARGDQITGSLTMDPATGTQLVSVNLAGFMGGVQFTANFR